mmetsp:Transcript_6480/g.15512  ORF Transcript_6480/g.15512 Transcript_6480/m.15512 type:complete len:89 (+) Transcript_6480:2074-2340(+)
MGCVMRGVQDSACAEREAKGHACGGGDKVCFQPLLCEVCSQHLQCVGCGRRGCELCVLWPMGIQLQCLAGTPAVHYTGISHCSSAVHA